MLSPDPLIGDPRHVNMLFGPSNFGDPRERDLSRVQVFSDKELLEWTEQRERGYKNFRRKLWRWMTVCFATGGTILLTLWWLEVLPSLFTLLIAVNLLVGSVIFSPMLAWIMGPMTWHTNEMRYYATLKERSGSDGDN